MGRIVFLLFLVAFGVLAPATAWVGDKTKLRVLLVLAHPDDETMLGGTLVRLKEMGAEVHAIYVTRGEGGRIVEMKDGVPHLVSIPKKNLVVIRNSELTEALSAYGVAASYQLNQPDFPLRDPTTQKPSRDGLQFLNAKIWDANSVSDAVRLAAQSFNPDFVITMSLDAGTHAHHKATRLIVNKLAEAQGLGSLLKGIMAVSEEHWVKEGDREARGSRIRFDQVRATSADGKTYAEKAFEGASKHASQLPGHTGPISEPEELYLVHGELSTFYKEVFGGQSCAHLFLR